VDDFLVESESSSPPRQLTRRELALRDIGGYRVVNTGGSVEVPVPADAEFFYCFAEDGDARLGIDLDANSSSSIFVHEDVPLAMYPIAPGQRLSCYGASGKSTSFRFLGRIREP